MATLKLSGISLLDLTTSNPTEALADYPHEGIRKAFSEVRDYAYHPDPFGRIEAREAIASYYSCKGITVSPGNLILTASTSEAYGILFKLLCDPGDDVLVPVPSYPLFEYLAALESVRVTPFRLRYDGQWYVDMHSLQEQVTPRTRAIVVVNPNNPTGSFLKKDEMWQLCAFAAERDLAIISDEVFTDYKLDHESPCAKTFIGNDSVLSFSLNGLSKCAGMPQMKLGWIVVNGPPTQIDATRRRLELICDTYLSVNTPVQNALTELLNIGNGVRDRLFTRASRNLDCLRSVLANGAAQPLRVEGGWSAIIRTPNIRSEEAWISTLLQKHRVIVQPGYFFDMATEAYLVVSLITPPEIFTAGIEAIRDATYRIIQL